MSLRDKNAVRARDAAATETPAATRPKPGQSALRSPRKPRETPERRPRDAEATSDRILEAAIAEFAAHGYAGARIDAIAHRANVNMRMLYHYFGSKTALYLSVLEAVFERIRLKEQKLNLKSMGPLPAMMKLFDFTYEHFASNPLFIRILTNENLLNGQYLARSVRVSSLSSPLLLAMKDVLQRGVRAGVFRKGVDPLQLYVTMVAMSYFHISNAPTLSHLFSTDLTVGRWQQQRRRHARDMLNSYLASK